MVRFVGECGVTARDIPTRGQSCQQPLCMYIGEKVFRILVENIQLAMITYVGGSRHDRPIRHCGPRRTSAKSRSTLMNGAGAKLTDGEGFFA